MSDGNQVQCDNCSEVFAIHLKEKHHPGNIIESYFKCPECDEKHITHVTDPWARKEQQDIKNMNDRLIKRKTKLSAHMDKLKLKVSQ